MSHRYTHVVQYYETDKMGITHHSNYVRWMEEARVGFLKEIGWEFTTLEALGIICPVVEISCTYKKPTVFAEQITIEVSVQEFKGVKLFIAYEMRNEQDEVVCTASSTHAFLDAEGRPIRIKQKYPGFYQALLESGTEE
ncbi:MAG: acyl-CoA thioesterase [Clostridiales bacterium]|nr:acyl-CoA thioesterase [Clostridiales bacterium]